MTITDTTSFTADWEQWHIDREAAAAAKHGLASVTGTHWLTSEPTSFPGTRGNWRAEDGVAVGQITGAQHVQLSPGDEIEVDGLLIRVQSGPRGIAVRTFDPAAPTRTRLRGIDAYPPSPQWVRAGHFTRYETPLATTITHADGSVTEEEVVGQVTFALGDHTVSLGAFERPDGSLQITFADATSGQQTADFRFLSLDAPGTSGAVTVDLNRTYLPPSTFTDHYLCPLPPEGNIVEEPIAAGEKRPILRD